jgi:hypothetical protein
VKKSFIHLGPCGSEARRAKTVCEKEKNEKKIVLGAVPLLRRAEGFSWRDFFNFEIFIFLDIKSLDLDQGLEPVLVNLNPLRWFQVAYVETPVTSLQRNLIFLACSMFSKDFSLSISVSAPYSFDPDPVLAF